MKYIFSILFVLTLMNCSNSTKEETPSEQELKIPYSELSVVQKIERRYQKEKFLSYDNVRFDIQLYFGGKERMNGTLTLATNSSQGKIEMKDGNKVYFIKDKVYFTPGMNENKARFDAYTWSYFFLFPYKLSDEGTKWSEAEKVVMNEKWYTTQRLTFASGTGDAPDDWYQVYSDTSSSLLELSAYIVTANKSVDKAEEDPHAIGYRKYEMLRSIPVATEWMFYGWTKQEGLTDTLGNAKLSNFEFIADHDSLFTPPADFSTI